MLCAVARRTMKAVGPPRARSKLDAFLPLPRAAWSLSQYVQKAGRLKKRDSAVPGVGGAPSSASILRPTQLAFKWNDGVFSAVLDSQAKCGHMCSSVQPHGRAASVFAASSRKLWCSTVWEEGRRGGAVSGEVAAVDERLQQAISMVRDTHECRDDAKSGEVTY